MSGAVLKFAQNRYTGARRPKGDTDRNDGRLKETVKREKQNNNNGWFQKPKKRMFERKGVSSKINSAAVVDAYVVEHVGCRSCRLC